MHIFRHHKNLRISFPIYVKNIYLGFLMSEQGKKFVSQKLNALFPVELHPTTAGNKMRCGASVAKRQSKSERRFRTNDSG